MKKMFLILISLLCISCSQLNSYVDGDVKNKLMSRGLSELATVEERKEFTNRGEFSFLMYKSPFAGILAQPLQILANSVNTDKEAKKAAEFIAKNYEKIIVSDNTPAVKDGIIYLSYIQQGREILPKCRFLFLNYVSREEIKNLSKELGFKYSYPSVDDVK